MKPVVTNQKRNALIIILLFGVVSLFGDIIYEGARSVYGPFTKTIAMDIALVGLITGIAEFLGYFIRLVSGYLSDKTKAHWIFTITGYGMLISIPLLAVSGIWQFVSVMIIIERLGKAVRSPAKDTILSQATKQIGTGWGFGLHEAMDQIGAILGPLIFTGVLLAGNNQIKTLADYQNGFRLLWIPFVILMASVLFAFIKMPNPEKFEAKSDTQNPPDKLSPVFRIYTLFSFLTTLGFMSFVILGYHFKETGIISDAQIPLFYAIAMGVDGIAALIIGKIYDRLKTKHQNEKAGLKALIVIPVLSLFIPILGFVNNIVFIISSVVLWGIVMGIHETIMKSSIADLTHFKKRGLGYGVFNTAYGLAMLFGSTLTGLLYKTNLALVIVLIVVVQIGALGVYVVLIKKVNRI